MAKKKIYDSRRESMSLLIFGDTRRDWVGNQPTTWIGAFTAMGIACGSQDRLIGYDKVCYFYDCDAYATDIYGNAIASMPIYKAAVVFYKQGAPEYYLLVKDRKTLDFMRKHYGATRMYANDYRLSDLWGNSVEVEFRECNMTPHQEGVLQDFAVVSLMGWDSEAERRIARSVDEPAANGNYATACCYRLETPDFEARFYHVHAKIYVDDDVIVLTQKDELVSNLVNKKES